MPTPQELLENHDESQCIAFCEHGSRCALPANHLPATRHETEHGCVCYVELMQYAIEVKPETDDEVASG